MKAGGRTMSLGEYVWGTLLLAAIYFGAGCVCLLVGGLLFVDWIKGKR